MIRTARHPHAIRREHNALRATTRWKGRICFGCANPATQEHHIVQIQHGGTNRHDNKVWVCNTCHLTIHPQLKRFTPGVTPGAVYIENGSLEPATCPACHQPVLAARSRLKRRPISETRRRFYLQADATPSGPNEYRTTDLHQPACFNKRGLNALGAKAMSLAVDQDIDQLAQAEPVWTRPAIKRALEVARG